MTANERKNFRKRSLKIGDKVRTDPNGPVMIVYDIDDDKNCALVNYIDQSFNLMVKLRIELNLLKLEPT
jgi:hypothetical protein